MKKVDVYVKQLKTATYPKKRWEAARALGALGDKRALKPLTEALNDESPTVRTVAANALEKLRDPRDTYPDHGKQFRRTQSAAIRKIDAVVNSWNRVLILFFLWSFLCWVVWYYTSLWWRAVVIWLAVPLLVFVLLFAYAGMPTRDERISKRERGRRKREDAQHERETQERLLHSQCPKCGWVTYVRREGKIYINAPLSQGGFYCSKCWSKSGGSDLVILVRK
jgi:hypothetical protein